MKAVILYNHANFYLPLPVRCVGGSAACDSSTKIGEATMSS